MSEETRFNAYPKVDQPARVKPYQEATRAALEKYQADYQLSQGQLARQLGVSSTAVSKYLNGKPEGDVARLEAVAADVIKNGERFRQTLIELFETSVSRAIARTIDTARKTNDFCVITGPGGIGKTCGALLYIKSHPSTIFTTAATWCRNAGDVSSSIWDAIDTAGYHGGMKKSAYLVDRLRGSKRTLIIDQAHRLKRGGIEFLLDFHDATQIPVCLIGNSEILLHFHHCGQNLSRVGQHHPIVDYDRRDGDEGRQIASSIIQQVAPEFAEVEPLATKVINRSGHARALRKQLLLADDIAQDEAFRAANPSNTRQAAFKLAHKKLIRDYDL